jgi:tRNA A37 threonylcarbamoyladenosine synthetase subunit TsaC/SUA5/YrdC
MNRPDIPADAQRVKDTVLAGGIAIVQGSGGYGIMSATPAAARRSFEAKRRAPHKRHGLVGNAEFRREAQILSQMQHDMIDAITEDFNLPVGVVAPVRLDHPVVRSIEPETYKASSVDGTVAVVHNNGALSDELARISLDEGVAFLGSSANLSGTGTKFRVEDIQHELIDEVDLVLDYGLAKYHMYRRSTTMINFATMQVIRIGCCYELISDILARFFSVECPPDPGLEKLPFGHLWEPSPIEA